MTINYTPAQNSSAGVNQLTLWDAWGPNHIEVDSVGQNTLTTIHGDTQDSLTGPAAGQVDFIPNYEPPTTGVNL